MNIKFNRRRYLFISKKNYLYFSLFIFILLLITVVYFKSNFFYQIINKNIEYFSKKFNYQLINFEIDGSKRVHNNFINKNLKIYLNTSIFSLPLEEITKNLKENNWIKNVALRTNFKDTLYINIDEYKPYGIYTFNNKLFYFNKNGKIIDELYNNNNNNNKFEKLFFFEGQSSNLKAHEIIDILNEFRFDKNTKIKKLVYVNKRRWNIVLDKNVQLLLSEKYPRISIENYLNIKKNLSEKDFNNIELVDLRNQKKITITYKND